MRVSRRIVAMDEISFRHKVEVGGSLLAVGKN
jgi:hypothetical protein